MESSGSNFEEEVYSLGSSDVETVASNPNTDAANEAEQDPTAAVESDSVTHKGNGPRAKPSVFVIFNNGFFKRCLEYSDSSRKS